MECLKFFVLGTLYTIISLYLLIIFPHILTDILGHYIGDLGKVFVLGYIAIMTYLLVAVIPFSLMKKYR